MAHPRIAVFARLADGGALPVRAIEGQQTLLGRTVHGFDYDPIHDEIIIPQQFGQAILTFRGGADGEEKPIRVIQGSKTMLAELDRLAVDPVNDEILVPEANKILVFPRTASGNVAPKRVLHVQDAAIVDVDPENNLLVVAGPTRGDIRISIFPRTAQGEAKPLSVISGPNTMLTSTRGMRVYNGWILMAQDGIQIVGGGQQVGAHSFVGVWSVHDQGNVSPRWTIGGPDGRLKKPRAMALDLANKTVIVTDKFLNAVLTYSVPQIFR